MLALLSKLKKLEKYSRTLPLTYENQEEFLSFCSLKLFEGRDVRTRDFLFYVDFMRWQYGRNTDGYVSRLDRLVYQSFEENQEPRTNEENILSRLHASQQVTRIMRKLCQEDRLLLYFFYFDDLSLKEISEIFGVSESAVSQKHKKILSKIRKFNFVANSENQL
jgi:RNA polymerase sigma factor (sigma-70 family)